MRAGKLKAVLDTNVVVFSFLKKESPPSAILKTAIFRKFIPVLSESILQEYRTVLLRKKFEFPEKMVECVLDELVQAGEVVNPEEKEEMPDLSRLVEDPGDIKFLEAALVQMLILL